MKKSTILLSNSILLILLLSQMILLIILISFVLTYRLGILDPFVLNHIAGLEYSVSSSNSINFNLDLFIDAKYVPGYLTFVYILSRVLGMSTMYLAYFPLAIILVCFSIFVFEWELLKIYSNSGQERNKKMDLNSSYNLIISILITIAIFFIILPDHYSIWNHTIGTFLYLIATYIFFIKIVLENSPKSIIVFVLLFIAISLFSYSRELWIISFILMFALTSSIITIISNDSKNTYKKKGSILTLIIVLGLTLGQRTLLRYMDIILYSQYFKLGWEYIMGSILRSSPNKFFEYYIQVPHIYTFFSFMFFMYILFPYFLYLRSYFKKVKSRNMNICNILTTSNIFVFSFLSVFIFDAVAYMRIGAFLVGLTRYLKFATTLFIPTILYQMKDMSKQHLKHVMVYILIVLMLLLPQYYYNVKYTINKDPEKLHYLTCPWGWYFEHQKYRQSKIIIYSDHYTQAGLSVLGAKDGIIIQPYLYTPVLYQALVNPEYTTKLLGTTIFINKVILDQPTKGNGWIPFKPIKIFYSSINTNRHLNVIYNSDKIQILRGV